MPNVGSGSIGPARFTGVYCSGFFIQDPALLTAMCLVFDQVHILNNQEYVRLHVSTRAVPRDPAAVPYETSLLKVRHDGEWVPIIPKDAEERRVLENYWYYMQHVRKFWHEHEALMGKVLFSSLFPDSEMYYAPPEAGNVNMKFSAPAEGGEVELQRLIGSGAVPVVGVGDEALLPADAGRRAKNVAALLAMQSVQLVLPGTVAASADTILEARTRLHDQLELFWAEMLRLSAVVTSRIHAGAAPEDILREAENVVQSTVRPAVIELQQKMLRERKNWFYRILGHAGGALRVVAGRPPVTPEELLKLGLEATRNELVGLAAGKGAHPRAGLTYLLDLSKHLDAGESGR